MYTKNQKNNRNIFFAINDFQRVVKLDFIHKKQIVRRIFLKRKKLEWKIDTFSAFFADSIMMSNINPGSLNSTNVLIFVVSHV